MKWVKWLFAVVCGLLILAPFAVACVSVWKGSLPLAITSIILVFVVVALLPFARGFERIWVYLVAALTVIPWNVLGICWWIQESEYGITFFPVQVARVMLIYIILFCTEELIFAWVGRGIWPKQRALFSRNRNDRD